MALYKIEDLSFSYPNEKTRAINHINYTIQEGDFVVLCGPTGSGKTTLLRHLKKELFPEGQREGSVNFRNTDIFNLDDKVSAREIGMVYQDPENQIVMDRVINELAFSLENIGLKPETIMTRISEMATYFGMEDRMEKPVHELSGGQKQILNLCSVLMLQPKILILDEPTSQLDPVASKELIRIIYELNQELAITVILSEHRLDDVFQYADQILFLENGEIKYSGTPEFLSMEIMEQKSGVDLEFLPEITRLCQINTNRSDNGEKLKIPLTVREGRKFIDSQREYLEIIPFLEKGDIDNQLRKGVKPIISCKELYFMYGPKEPLIIKNLCLDVYPGDYIGILGGNGSGKTTLLKIICGILTAQRGKMKIENENIKKMDEQAVYQKIGYVAQNPLLHFTFDTVEEELRDAKTRSPAGDDESWMEELVSIFDLQHLMKRHPYDCSGGQQQKIAIATALISKPSVLLLDEPTKGLDPHSKVVFSELLEDLNTRGITIILVTHDVEFSAKYIRRCAMLFNGQIVFDGAPREFFSNNYFYTTKTNRVMKELLPEAITIEDVIKQCRIKD
jgi:energy-coupling factor transport system ATP-binding protein